MTDLAIHEAVLSPDEARSLTDEVKHDADRLWRKLVELYEGGAHLALGYSSWSAYFGAEFGGSDATAYRLLQSGRALGELPMGSPRPKNERQARELVPLLDEPDQLREAWVEASANGKQPTAREVREVVQMRLPPKPPTMATERDQHATMVRVWDGACRVLDDSMGNAAAKVAHLIEYDGPGPVTSQRLETVADFCRRAAIRARPRTQHREQKVVPPVLLADRVE